MKFLGKLEKTKEFWFLLIASVFFFLLRFPSLFEPYWYGDEGIYQVLGMGIRQGKLLYRDIFDNKPPLLYVFYSFFNGDQFWIRFLSLVFGLGAVIAFFYLSKLLFKKTKIAYLTTSIFAVLFGLPIIEGNIANAENFMLLPLILGAILIVWKKHFKYKYFLAGLLVGIAFLVKIVAVFDFAGFFIFIILTNFKFNFKNLKNKSLPILSLILGFVLPIFLTTVFFVAQGAFPDFIKATFFSNIGYVSYGNKFLIPQGLLILKLVALGLFTFLVLKKRDKLGIEGIFIYLWFAFSLYNAFFSQRPYTHYLLVLLPSFCLLIGFALDNAVFRKFSFLVLLITIILVVQNFWIFTKTEYYYQNFLSFIVGKNSTIEYENFFDRNVPLDNKLASYINNNELESDSIFLWGNNAQLYKLTNKLPPEKYVVAYHILSYKDGYQITKNVLIKTKPKLIIIMPNVPSYPFSLSGYNLKIIINSVAIYERIL